MSKEKQIEEMARIIADVNATLRCSIEVCRLCEFFEVDGEMCKDCISAKALYEAGYRKQSEGEWILTQEKRLFGDKYYTCSNCQSINPTMIKFNYCFNCGATMKGD